MKKILALSVALSGIASAAGFVGLPLNQKAFPLCVDYGCQTIGKYTDHTEIFGDLTTYIYQLKKLDVKVRLATFDNNIIQSIELIILKTPPDENDTKLFIATTAKAMGITYRRELFDRCFDSLDLAKAQAQDMEIRSMRANGNVTEHPLDPAIGEDKNAIAVAGQIGGVCFVRPVRGYGSSGIRIFIGD